MTNAQPELQTVKGRLPKQKRSERARRLIADAAIRVIANHGVSGVTHRLVSREAGSSLSATTYYFETKADIIGEAANIILSDFPQQIEESAEPVAPCAESSSFRDEVIWLVEKLLGASREQTQAWCELVLDAARHGSTRFVAREWLLRFSEVWEQNATAFGPRAPRAEAGAAADLIIGLVFVGLALELSGGDIAALLRGANFLSVLPRQTALRAAHAHATASPKTQATRAKILQSAAAILMKDGVSAVTYRSVAAEARMSPAAPVYHFPTNEDLLAATQSLLFAESKVRYREVMTGKFLSLDLARTIDLTAVIFQREATEFGPANVANYTVWLEAARRPNLRPMVREMVEDQHRAWLRIFGALSTNPHAADPLVALSLFVGKLIRCLANGVSTAELAGVRAQFAQDFSAISQGTYW